MNTDTSHPTRAPARFSSTAHAILVAFVLATLIHGFFSPYVSVERWTIVLWLLAFTWVYGGLELLTHVLESDSRPLRRGIASACGIYGGITVGASLLFLTTQELTRALGREPADIALPYPLFTLTTLVALGFTFLRPPQLLAGRRVRGAAVVYCAAAAAALSVANTTHIRPLRADVYHEAASIAWERDGDGERAASLGRRAVALAPRQDVYHHFLAQLAVERAAKAPSEPARDALFEESRRALLEARALSPLLVDHASNLARLHQIWSGQANQEDARAKHLSESLRLYQVAAALGPNRPKTWIDWGLCCQLAGDEEGALEKFQHALRLDATYAETHIFLGAFHASREDWQAAAGAYEHAVLHEPGSVVAHRNLGDVYRQLGRATAAALQYHRVLELQPNDTTSHHILALMYRAAGHADAALTHARQALTEAPPSERAALTILVEELDAEVD